MEAITEPRPPYDQVLDEVTQRGCALYETQLKAGLERDYMGQMVVIHPDSGDYAVAKQEEEAVRALRAQHSD